LADYVSDAGLARTYPDEVTARAVDLMISADQGRLPVVDPQTGALVGLLTRRRLLQVRAEVNRAEGERRAYYPTTARRRAVRTVPE
jgi:CBS domain-containing protein